MILSFSEMINSSSFKAKLGKAPFIEMISSMFEQCENKERGPIMDEYRRALFVIIESMAKHNKVLVSQHKEII
jgi:hypothetical protein